MRKLFTLFVVLFAIASGASAQDQLGKFSAAANLNYGTEIESLGIGLRAQYGFTENVRGALEYKYYIDRNAMSAWEINANGHYVFGSSDELLFYPIAGLKYARWTWDPGRIDINGVVVDLEKQTFDRLGLNLGFGAQIQIGEKLFFQPELSYEIIKDYSQFVISAGIMYQF